ncbi:unnamed protein product, partial [Amoebophrya sp. A25]
QRNFATRTSGSGRRRGSRFTGYLYDKRDGRRLLSAASPRDVTLNLIHGGGALFGRAEEDAVEVDPSGGEVLEGEEAGGEQGEEVEAGHHEDALQEGEGENDVEEVEVLDQPEARSNTSNKPILYYVGGAAEGKSASSPIYQDDEQQAVVEHSEQAPQADDGPLRWSQIMDLIQQEPPVTTTQRQRVQEPKRGGFDHHNRSTSTLLSRRGRSVEMVDDVDEELVPELPLKQTEADAVRAAYLHSRKHFHPQPTNMPRLDITHSAPVEEVEEDPASTR